LVFAHAKRKIVAKAALAAGERSPHVARCIVAEAEFLEAARETLPQALFELESALASDDGNHVRYAS
jgi:hypothetical protein